MTKRGSSMPQRITASDRKEIPTCVYCTNLPDGEEHWLIRALGTFSGNSFLTGRVCTPCNTHLGRTIDQELARTGPTGFNRQLLGIEGRSHHAAGDAFDYKALQAEPPIQLFRDGVEGPQLVLERALRRNPDGTVVGARRRHLVVAMPDGRHLLPFPRGWTDTQLRTAAEARGLLGGRPVEAHVPPPETLAEFTDSARPIIKAVFGPFALDAFTSTDEGDTGDVTPTRVRFNLSTEYVRAVAKTAFHYLLWACPHVGGNEPEFSAIRDFIRHGVGRPGSFVWTADSLVERGTSLGPDGPDCHMFAAFRANGDTLVTQVHFFSPPVGPASPTFGVVLGSRPPGLPPSWQRGHIAAYARSADGHSGVLRELRVG